MIRCDDPDVLDRLRRERLAQGLPPTLEDPVAIRRLALLFLAALDRLDAGPDVASGPLPNHSTVTRTGGRLDPTTPGSGRRR